MVIAGEPDRLGVPVRTGIALDLLRSPLLAILRLSTPGATDRNCQSAGSGEVSGRQGNLERSHALADRDGESGGAGGEWRYRRGTIHPRWRVPLAAGCEEFIMGLFKKTPVRHGPGHHRRSIQQTARR